MCAGPLLGEGVVAEDRSSGTHRSPRRIWLIAAICGIVVVQVVYGILVIELLGPRMDVRGQFGDLFGGVTALFTGLAFGGVIYTILLQSNELELQREELRLNREELHRSADAQLQQVKRLEEAAELSAISTLVNTYSAVLQPLRDATHQTRVDMAWQERQRAAPEADKYIKEAADDMIEQLKVHLSNQEQGWSDTLQKHQELVERLETLVRQRSQGNGAAQKTE
jgi:hypothetical protein